MLSHIILEADIEQGEDICASQNPIDDFAGHDIGALGPIELAGIFARLTNCSLEDVLQDYDYLNPTYGDEDGPWVVVLPEEFVERFAAITDDDLIRLNDEWPELTNELEQALELTGQMHYATLSTVVLKNHLQHISKICADSVRDGSEIMLWYDL